MLAGGRQPAITLVPRAVRRRWMRDYARIVFALATAYEVVALARGATSGFGYDDAVTGAMYAILAVLFGARAPDELRVAYILAALAVAQVFAFVAVGFTGVAPLIPCALPVLAALFVGGRSPYFVVAGSLASFVAVGVLRTSTQILPPVVLRAMDPHVPSNWVGLALALAVVAGPVVWLVGQLTSALETSFAALHEARALHEAEVRLRAAAEAALERAVEQKQRARRAEASGLVVAGVVHDLRNYLNVLQLWAESLANDPSADRSAREPLTRVRRLCEEATQSTRDLLRITRPQETRSGASCRVVEHTRGVAELLRASLPRDFEIVAASTLTTDPEVEVAPPLFAAMVLELTAAAHVLTSGERSVRFAVREPTADERDALVHCAAVVELTFGAGAELAFDVPSGLVQPGCRVLLPREGEPTVRLLLRAAEVPETATDREALDA